ncbi:hypothetical protein FGO68_gene14425 [Halteria grandinella]|uniref:S1/P1 nuclease n=1 Tax=Halteria grandinella TaxID=5974 RepID=A0A8J8T0W8_HALGN|nr:hypothetical protein FGO68_gene14425 [Halteria grandinella]
MRHNLSSPANSSDEDTSAVERPQTEEVGRSYALRLLIHYLGDVHQPLHCSSRVDKSFPEGDKGGNMFPLPNHYESDDLHAVWDSVLYNYHGRYVLPFTDASYLQLAQDADDLLAKHRNITSLLESQSLSIDVEAWAGESHRVAPQAYNGAVQNEKLSEGYLEGNLSQLEQLIIKGGFRLAHLLEHIFNETTGCPQAYAGYGESFLA